MRRLAAEERDGLGGAHRDAHDGPGGAVDAARQVDAENRRAVGVDRLDHLERIAFHRPIEPGTEQRIDDQRRPADRLGIARQHRIFPSARRGGRVTLQAIAFTQQDDRDVATARRQFSRRHEAIAAIVAAAGDHQDRPFLHQVDRRLRNGLTRAQHQRKAGRTRGNAQPIGTLHLSGIKNFHADFPIPAPYPEAFAVRR